MALSVNLLFPSGIAIFIAGTPTHNFSKSLTKGAINTAIFSAVGDLGPGISSASERKNFFVTSHDGRLYTVINSTQV
jgi:hypothetical protein